MAHSLEIRATAYGPGYFYRTSNEWDYIVDEGVAWITAALAEIAERAQELAKDGKGDITGEFLTILDGNATSLMVKKLSKKDVAKIERMFHVKALELVTISESK